MWCDILGLLVKVPGWGLAQNCSRQIKRIGGAMFGVNALRRQVPTFVVVMFYLLSAGCGQLLAPPNSLLEDVRETDLSPQYPTRVRQPTGTGAGAGPRRVELYPGDTKSPVQPVTEEQRVLRNDVTRSGNGYQLNFESADVAVVSKAVLGDTLRIPYVLDTRVQGQLTLSTGRPVSQNELIKVFETALRLNNGALVSDGNGGYRIIPAGEAAAGEIGHIGPLDRSLGVLPGYGVTIMPLRHISSEAMIRLLEGFLARGGSARAEAVGNLLLIRGSAREREVIADVVDMFDVDWLKGQSAGIFPLVHASPDAIIQELNAVLQNEQNTLSSNMIRFQPIARLNAVLVLARRPEALQTAGTWIRRLDKSNTAGDQLFVYQVENGKAVDIAEVLNDTFGAGGGGRRRSARAEVAPGRDALSTVSTGSFDQKAATTPGQQQTSSPDTPSGVARQKSRGTGIGGLTDTLTSGGSGATAPIDVRIVADEANNSLLIRASQSDYQKILSALRRIDRPPLQVLINATIAEVTLNNALRYGVQAYLKSAGGSRGSVGYHPGNTGSTIAETLTLTPSFPGFNLLVGNLVDPKVVLDALASVTSVKVVSSPSLVVVDNQSATLKVGDEVPIATQQAQSTISPDAPILNTIRFRETGVILKVTPRVNSSGLVTMDIEQEISQVAGTAPGQGTSTLTPTISQRRIASTIAVYSGQSVVLGGLINEQSNSDKKSVPIINRIPMVGDLLGKTEMDRKRTELIVFIKPEVIRNSRDASLVSQDMRSRLKSMAFEPAPAHPHDLRRTTRDLKSE